jgi:hypothetical protein
MQPAQEFALKMHLPSVAILAFSFLVGCQGTPPARESGTSNSTAPQYPNYYLTDDNWPYQQQHDVHWNIALSKCGMLANAQINPAGQTCVVDLIRKSLSDNDFAAQYCTGIESFVVHSGCLVSVSLSIDLQRRAQTGSEYAVFRGTPNSGYPWALGRAATSLAESIWQECAGASALRTCREDATAKRLGMTSANQASCSTWEQDAEVVLCLFRLHIANRMVEATRQLESL